MAISDQQRHFMIDQAVRRRSGADNGADVNMGLWEGLGRELRAIIGERGFASLYASSLHRAAESFPWLAPQAGDAFQLPALH